MKKIIFLVLLFLPSTIVLAGEKIYNPDDFPVTQRSYFDMTGKRYIAKKDNPFLMERFNNPIFPIYYKVFLKTPSRDSCSNNNTCERKRITSEMKFMAEAIVPPFGTTEDIASCNKDVISCYFKLRFDDGDTAYMNVFNFFTAASPSYNTAMNHPGFLQVYLLNPDESWKDEKRLFDTYFKEIGVHQGYTKEDVLKSQWGKPVSKTRSSLGNVDVDIWMYDDAMLTFKNGHVISVTVTE